MSGEAVTLPIAQGGDASGPLEDRPTSSAPSAEFLSLIPHEFARRHLVLSAGTEGGVERVLAAEGTRPHAVFNVGVALGRAVRPETAPVEAVAAAVDEAYARHAGEARAGRTDVADSVVVEGSGDVEADLADAVREAERDLLHTHGKAPAVRLVDLILFEALLRSASDVHVQPVRGRTLVRYRLDGVLHTVRELPFTLAAALTSRIKVMARMDVAEQRAPQDGRATVTIGGAWHDHARRGQPGGGRGSATGGGDDRGAAGRRVDLRVSTLPSTYGERVVVRLLDPARSVSLLTFAAWGCPSPSSASTSPGSAEPAGSSSRRARPGRARPRRSTPRSRGSAPPTPGARPAGAS